MLCYKFTEKKINNCAMGGDDQNNIIKIFENIRKMDGDYQKICKQIWDY